MLREVQPEAIGDAMIVALGMLDAYRICVCSTMRLFNRLLLMSVRLS
jgi:hypothetical protein